MNMFDFQTNSWNEMKFFNESNKNFSPCLDSHTMNQYNENSLVVFGGFVGSNKGDFSNKIYLFNL